MEEIFSAKVAFWPIALIAIYFLLFAVATAAIIGWEIHRRRERPPEKFKLLRGPGETLRRRVSQADEALGGRLAIAAMVPIGALFVVLLVAARLPKEGILFGLLGALLVFAICLILAKRWLSRHVQRRRDDLLGYLGERAVAEQLEPLAAQGYRIFHDVPVEGRDRLFNLDHVVIGPTGVTLVETKTRRKRPARPGFQEHVVTYDGTKLVWPWGEDSWGLEQVRAEIDWLRKWIEQRIGLKIRVKPILAIPGWYVMESSAGDVRVANQKVIPKIITQWNPQPLTPDQIDLIARQLDDRCRDVED